MSDVQMTIGELLQVEQSLARVAAERLPVKAAYQVARLLKVVRRELETFYEQRNELVREFGEPRETTPEEQKQGLGFQVMSVLPRNMQAYAEKVQELVTISVTVAASPLALSTFNGLEVTATDVLQLGPFIVEEEERVEK